MTESMRRSALLPIGVTAAEEALRLMIEKRSPDGAAGRDVMPRDRRGQDGSQDAEAGLGLDTDPVGRMALDAE